MLHYNEMAKKRFHLNWGNPLKIRPKFPIKFKKITWKGALRTLGIASVVVLIGTAFLFAWYAKDLPNPEKIQNRKAPEATQILDRNGNTLYAVFGDEKRLSIPFDQIPTTVKDATIAIEDKNFYKHHGVDFRGIIRGVILKPLSGERAQGGSTVTQQYVKNALLTSERSLDRKIKELILALELEFMFTKDEILHFYLNEIPYGSNAYGIQAAAETYFGKSANDLSLAESATLAALPQRPTYLSPYGSHTDELMSRQKLILTKMAEQGYITVEEAEAAKTAEVKFVPRKEQINAPHFVFFVRDLLVEKYGEQLVLEGGLKVTTTLDGPAQKAAEEAIQNVVPKLKAFDADNAGLAAIDPRNGQIMAMVGSVDYFDLEHNGNFNVTTGSLQPGSSFKPLVYAAGLKDRFSPSSILWDVPTDFGKYKPNNFDGNFRGPVTIRAALASSLNIPAVKMLALTGINKAAETARDLGITTLGDDPNQYGLSMVLGTAGVRPVDMAAAYGVFANGGVRQPLSAILKVEDSHGKILEEWKEDPKNVLAPEIAYEISHILIDNEARTPVFGARSALYFPERPVAVKTGTTQEYHDSWTVGYTPSISAAVWVGNNNNEAMDRAGGVRAAAPIFHDFITKYYKGKPAEPFVRPDTIKEVTVDALSGKLPTEHSPQAITDIFAPWQVPTAKDDIHVGVQVNKETGQLATEFTPPDLIETRIFTTVHSERPKDPRWELPVLAWARDKLGLHLENPPTDKDTSSPDQLPSLSITAPVADTAVTGPFDITVSVNAPRGVRSVDFSIDGSAIGSKTESPFSLLYDPGGLTSGNHELTVQVTDTLGAKASKTQLFIIAQDQTPPDAVKNPNANSGGVGSGSVTVTWKNPTDPDLAKVRIYQSTVKDQLGTLVQEVPAAPSASDSVTIAGHAAGTFYYYSIRPLDTSGNENTDAKQVSVLAL